MSRRNTISAELLATTVTSFDQIQHGRLIEHQPTWNNLLNEQFFALIRFSWHGGTTRQVRWITDFARRTS